MSAGTFHNIPQMPCSIIEGFLQVRRGGRVQAATFLRDSVGLKDILLFRLPAEPGTKEVYFEHRIDCMV